MRYFKNTSWLFAEKILRLIVGLFVGVWVARYLSPTQFGLFSYVQSFVGLFAAFATLGLDGIVVRELVKDLNRREELIGTAFWLKLFGAVVMLIMLSIVVSFISNDTTINTLIFIVASATIFQTFNVVDMYFQSIVLSCYVVYANITSLLISSIIKIVLIIYEAPLIAFAWTIFFDSFVLACGFVYFYTKNSSNLNILHIKFSKSTAMSLLKDSWPLMFGGISFMIFSNIDTIMIKEFLNDYSVGIYSAAYRLVTLWYFLPGIILSSSLPSLVNTRDNIYLFNRRILLISTLLVWISLFIFGNYYIFNISIIDVTYGHEYKDAAKILALMSAVNILIFYNSLYNQWMMIENKTKRTLVFHFFTAFFNIVLNYFLIKIYGLIGAIFALLFSLILTFLIFSIFDKRIYKVFISSILLEILWKK